MNDTTAAHDPALSARRKLPEPAADHRGEQRVAARTGGVTAAVLQPVILHFPA
jgi:hypothetical protein